MEEKKKATVEELDEESKELYTAKSTFTSEYLNSLGFDKLPLFILKLAKKDFELDNIPYKEVEIVYPLRVEPYSPERHCSPPGIDDSRYSWCIEYIVRIKK